MLVCGASRVYVALSYEVFQVGVLQPRELFFFVELWHVRRLHPLRPYATRSLMHLMHTGPLVIATATPSLWPLADSAARLNPKLMYLRV
jgi:hypothetical protein